MGKLGETKLVGGDSQTILWQTQIFYIKEF
jgi:hypothetical protein